MSYTNGRREGRKSKLERRAVEMTSLIPPIIPPIFFVVLEVKFLFYFSSILGGTRWLEWLELDISLLPRGRLQLTGAGYLPFPRSVRL